MRVVFSIIGAVLGLSLANGSRELFGILLGGFAGFGIAELSALRVRLKQLEGELEALRKVGSLPAGRATGSQQGTGPSAMQPASGWSAAAASAARTAPGSIETATPVRPVAPESVHPTVAQDGSAPRQPLGPTSPAGRSTGAPASGQGHRDQPSGGGGAI